MRIPVEAFPAAAAAWLADQATLPCAPVTLRPPRGDVFLDATIEGQRYQAFVRGDGLYLSAKTGVGGCAVGVASINHQEGEDAARHHGWQLCKYGNQPHLALPLSARGLRALALTFGLPVEPWLPPELRLLRDGSADFFYASGVFAALERWAAAHPRKVRGVMGDSYLGLWPLSALEGERVRTTAETWRGRGGRHPARATGRSAAVC
jgi:hypothetical protein